MPQKSTIEEIRERFDRDVERFSNLETGLRLLADTGFTEFEVLHRNCVFACYYGKR